MIAGIRRVLRAILAVCALAALWQLGPAWHWQLGPALGLGEAPLRAGGKVVVSMPLDGGIDPMTRRRHGSSGFVTSATFSDADGRLRVVHAWGPFVAHDARDPVAVAYRAPLVPGAEPDPRTPHVPAEAEGVLLTFDALYALPSLLLAMTLVVGIVLAGARRLGAGVESAARAAAGVDEGAPRVPSLDPRSSSRGDPMALAREAERERAGRALGEGLRQAREAARRGDAPENDD